MQVRVGLEGQVVIPVPEFGGGQFWETAREASSIGPCAGILTALDVLLEIECYLGPAAFWADGEAIEGGCDLEGH